MHSIVQTAIGITTFIVIGLIVVGLVRLLFEGLSSGSVTLSGKWQPSWKNSPFMFCLLMLGYGFFMIVFFVLLIVGIVNALS